MKFLGHLTLVSWALGLSLFASNGHATDAASSAAAEALFGQGRDLAAQGNYAAACPKFAESQRLDPGTGTLLNLAECYEKAGLLASAWTTWLEAARSARAAGQAERETLARKAAQALEGRYGTLTVDVLGDRPSSLKVTRNNLELSSASWGTALPTDAGNYRIEATAPGHELFSTEVAVRDGAGLTVSIPELTKSAPLPPSPPPAHLAPSVADESPSKGSTQRALGWTALGTGAAGIIAGSVLGILTIQKNNESKTFCSPTDENLCSRAGVDLREQALTFGDASTVAFGAGGALLIGGFVLLITAPKATPQSAELKVAPSPFGGSVTYQGSF